ncbi:hypothetical protein ACQE32_10165 [Pantoea sp. FN0302]|uniref:CDI toxin immunity protein n=1 Tax=Pantoea sp. FN0302 TaxID=3418558 RepID=UPI003CF1C923
MTLFDECKEALRTDFSVVEGEYEKIAINILKSYPFVNGAVRWDDIKYSDYENADRLLEMNFMPGESVFVLADDIGISIFKTNLKIVLENIYDVTALSPKIFVFSKVFILQPLFPSEAIRLGLRRGIM